jgi:hypothetical protein
MIPVCQSRAVRQRVGPYTQSFCIFRIAKCTTARQPVDDLFALEGPLHCMTDHWTRNPPGDIERFAIGDLILSSRDRAVFDARDAGDQSSAAFCWLFERDERDTPDVRVNRFLEASFLHHPNLLRVFSAGATGDTLYAITEPFDVTLADQKLPYASNLEDLQSTVAPICAALSWLHSHDFVYCALSENFVVQCAGIWKLADFSELRINERTTPAETRRLLVRRDLYAPPEAYEGVISPAWDAWSVGVLIEKLWFGNGSASGRKTTAPMPLAVSDLIRELADPDPSQRPTLDDVGYRLSKMRGPEAQLRSVPVRDGAVIEASPVPQQISPERGGAGEVEVPERVNASDRVRVAAIVILLVGAVTILAASYGRREVASGSRAARTQVSSGEYEPELASATTRSSSAPHANPYPAETADASLRGVLEKRDVSALLDGWMESTRQRDANQQSTYYAARVGRYFGWRNISVDTIRRAKERALGRVQADAAFSISDVRFERLDPERAVISFRKRWDFPSRHSSTSSREEMILNRIDGVWKIASERDLNRAGSRSEPSRLPGPDMTEPDSILNYESDRSIHAMAGNR